MSPKQKRTQHKWTDREKAAALAQLTLNRDNVDKTAAELGVPIRTLYRWRNAENCNVDVPVLAQEKKADLADRFEALAFAAVNQCDERLPLAKSSEAAIIAGIAVDKMRLLRGESTERLDVCTSMDDEAILAAADEVRCRRASLPSLPELPSALRSADLSGVHTG